MKTSAAIIVGIGLLAGGCAGMPGATEPTARMAMSEDGSSNSPISTEPLEDMTPQEVGRSVRERLVNEKNLKVRSVQKVSYVKNELTGDSPAPTTDAWQAIQTSENVSSVTVTIVAEMTPDSYKVDMYNEGRESRRCALSCRPNRNRRSRSRTGIRR